MEFGVTMFPTDFSMGPADLAMAVEERGLDALFIPDHTHIPAGSDEAFRIADKMPPDYSHNIDMFIGLAAAAAVTKRIRLGTGICLVVERDPIITAKEVASIDHISGGRVDRPGQRQEDQPDDHQRRPDPDCDRANGTVLDPFMRCSTAGTEAVGGHPTGASPHGSCRSRRRRPFSDRS